MLLTRIVLAVALTATPCLAQEPDQHVTVTVAPAGTVEERVSDEYKAKRLRDAADEKLAAERSDRAASTRPAEMLRRARTIYVESNTSFFTPIQLQDALRRRDEFETWQLAIVDGWDRRSVADVVVTVDRPLFTYFFTYQLTDRATGIVLASGKVTAWDGNAAAPGLAKKIVEAMKTARRG